MLDTIRELGVPDLAIVSPDAGGLKRAQRYALALEAPLAVVAKDRPRVDIAVPLQALGDVRDRTCLIVDDMPSTACTVAAGGVAARAQGRFMRSSSTR